MVFSELIKIPIAAAPETDIPAQVVVQEKPMYRNPYTRTINNMLYTAVVIDDMLIMTVYHDNKFCWRTFITYKEYFTQKCEDKPNKSTAGFNSMHQYNETYISANGADEIIQGFVDKSRFYISDVGSWYLSHWALGVTLKIDVRNPATGCLYTQEMFNKLFYWRQMLEIDIARTEKASEKE